MQIGPGDTVVDVGCGEGEVCVYAGRHGAAVVGIDICEKAIGMADAAMRNVHARSWRPIVSDCNPIPLPDGCATVVVCTEVLEHVPDPAKFLSELSRIGAPGALYVISVPDPASEGVMRAVAPEWYWKPPFHSRVFEHKTLDAMTREVGLIQVARASRGFQQSVWWAFRFAIGAQVGEPTPDHPALRHWDAAWRALVTSPDGLEAAAALDRALPKSQILLARKADGKDAAGGTRPAWKRALRFAGFNLRWPVRRTSSDHLGAKTL